MNLTEEQINSYSGKELDEIREELRSINYSQEEIKRIISQIDESRIANEQLILKRKQGFAMIVIGSALSLISASVFLVLYFQDAFKGKTSFLVIIFLTIGYFLIKVGRMQLKK